MRNKKNLFKTMLVLAMAMIMTLAMGITALAAEPTYTITVKSKDVATHTYKAYQIFAGDISDGKLVNIVWGTGVKNDLLDKLKEDETIGTAFGTAATANDVVSVLSEKQSVAGFVDKFAEIVAANLADTATATSTVTDADASLEVPGGYYLINDQASSLNEEDGAYTRTILKVSEDITITAKSEAPSLTKTFADGATYNNATVGDTISYKITTKVPDTTGYTSYSFVVNDTLSAGLDYAGNVNVTIGGAEVEVTPTVSGKNITFDLSDAISEKAANAAVVITYDAKLNNNAVMTNEGNPNTANLVYSNNPSDSSSKGKTPDSTVITYTTKVTLTKKDGSTGNLLNGVKFKLKNDNGYVVEKTTTEGIIEFERIGAGTYTLSETEALPGYNEIADMVLTVSFDKDADPMWSASLTQNGENSASFDSEKYTVKFDVENNQGIVLPTTGGIGTTIFYVVGGILVVGAAILLVTKKRMSAEEN